MSSGSRSTTIPQTYNCARVYIQRDYGNGTVVKFQTTLPPELTDKVCC